MKTIYDKSGKPYTIAQDLDAHIAIQTGKYFVVPPGKKAPLPKEQQVSRGAMNSQQLVDYAKEKFGAELDPLVKKNALLKMVEDLEKPHEGDLEDAGSVDGEEKPKLKTRKHLDSK